MKRIKFLSICCVAVFLLTACSNKITVKGENDTEYESYQECCAAQDFQAAHQYLAKLKNSNSEEQQKQWNEAKEYVFRQEALYLMSIGDETAKKRILYLLKEEGENITHVEMLMDLAIENDDEAFVMTLVNQFPQGYEGKGITAMIEYISSKNFEENKDFLEKYAADHFSLNIAAIVNFYAARKKREYSDIIIGKLTEEACSISKKPKMGVTKEYKYDGEHKMQAMCNLFSISTKNYNQKCQEVLGIAIKNRNLYLAQRTVSQFKSNINVEIKEDNTSSRHYNVFTVTSDNNDINEAKATLNEAIRSGAFK